MASQHFGLVEELDTVMRIQGEAGKQRRIGLGTVHEHQRLLGCCRQGTRLRRNTVVSEEALM